MNLQGIIREKQLPTTFSDKTTPGPLDRVNRNVVGIGPQIVSREMHSLLLPTLTGFLL